MKTATATALKNNLGEVMQAVAREPVRITKQGRDYAVMLSITEYERLTALEDDWWAQRARQAEAEGGYLGEEESMSFLTERLRGL